MGEAGSGVAGLGQDLTSVLVASETCAVPLTGAVFQVTDGQIQGGTVKFSIGTFTVGPCPYNAIISDLTGSTAVALRGTGHCILPGHPRSESPIPADPSPGGTSTAISWTAVRQ